MGEESAIKQRLIEFVKFKRISIREFERNSGLSYNYVNSIRVSIQPDKLQGIVSHYKELNPAWVMTGEGEMLTINPNNSHNNDKRPHVTETKIACGSPNGFNSAITRSDCEMLSLPLVGDYDFSIAATGDSMINRNNPRKSIRPGDIIACRIVKTRSYIQWGEVYALATQDGFTVKKIVESEKEGFIKCIPFNEEDGFKAFEVPVSEIYDWALVVGVASIVKW